MKFQILAVFVLLSNLNLQAQHQISGQVLSAEQKPIEFASVSIFPLEDSSAIKGVVSDQKGYFEIRDLKTGSYQITVQMLGYRDWTKALNLSAAVTLDLITLEEEATQLEAIQVVALQSVVETHLGKKVLRIGQDLSTTGSNALEALEIIPAVTTTPRGQVQIRGSSNIIIYINGKETRRDPSTLKFIAAESLEKIEIITNPSAKYDAEGVGGIINVVYKKDLDSAFKLELISNFGVLTNPFYLSPNGGANISWTKKKISLYTNLSHDYGEYEDYVDFKRINAEDNLQRYENRNKQKGLGKVSNALIGFSIEPDSTTSIGLEINYDRWDLAYEIEQQSIFEYKLAENRTVVLPSKRGEIEDELWVNLALEKEMPNDQILKVSLTAGGEDESNFTTSESVDLTDLPTNVQQFLLSSDELESQRYYHGKVDYTIPFFNWGTIETGLKADFIRYRISQKIALRSDTLQLPDNEFDMDLQKLGVYLIQKHKIKKLEYAMGLRLEQFASEAFQLANQSTFTQQYIRLFPSVQFNYLLQDQKQTIGMNYTRRIYRPGFFDLNPYVSYEDPLNLETGNPALEPEIADLLELNYHREWKPISLDLTLYNRKTNDAIQSIVEPIDNNRSLSTSVNIGSKLSRGLEAQLVYRANKTFKATGTFVLSQNVFESTANEISYNRRSTWSARMKQEFKLKNNWKIDFSQIYRAPSYQIQEKRLEMFYVNVGIGKKFNNKRGALTLSVRDIFNTRRYAVSLLTSNFEIERSYKWQTRQITLGLKYILVDQKK